MAILSFHNVSLSFLVLLLAFTTYLYKQESFEPAPMPMNELTQPIPNAITKNSQILKGSEFVGTGKLHGPEDIAYDRELGIIYTGCDDGWIKRVTVNDSVADSVIENWVNTGGRPLGIDIGRGNEIVVADAYKGLLKINEEGEIEYLTNEAEGIKFKLTDGVDIAEDGTIYFTDASNKYNLQDTLHDIFEGKPNGRIISYDPATKDTKVLVRDLYFPNGIAISPNQEFIVFCETTMRRCNKFYIQGNKKGLIENFVRVPGMPDNIHSDGQGQFWIGLASGNSVLMNLLYRFPVIRKLTVILMRFVGPLYSASHNAGVYVVDVEGNPIAHYYDYRLKMITTGVKIGARVYCGSTLSPHILRFNIDSNPAQATT